MKNRIFWRDESVPGELRPMLEELSGFYPVARGEGKGLSVSFSKSEKSGICAVETKGKNATVTYSSPAQALRGLGALLSGIDSTKDSTPFESLGIMLDCSRNAVMKTDHVKVWLRQLALMGYNMVMLYTEDTYELPGEPYFGYQRGAYTQKELQEIDGYAAKFGIEVVPCLQTLGHLEKILRHGAYEEVKDNPNVLLVGEEKTYQLIEKMVSYWKKTCRTDRIHIGMDETFGLGRGKYMDLHGYRNAFEIFNEHLDKVVKICKKHGLNPMIWSDMYFRLGSKTHGYYDRSAVIPKEVINKIPAEAELVYWDYYNEDKEFYLEWIKRHRKMNKEPLMGSGIWTWNRYWYDHVKTMKAATPCVEACREAKLKEIFFTQWGDNGAYCDHDSAFAGMLYFAEKTYGAKIPAEKDLEKRFSTICGGSYKGHILAGEIHNIGGWENPDMWDDPIFETKFRSRYQDNTKKMAKTAEGFASLAKKLKPYSKDSSTGDLKYARAIAEAFAGRYELCANLLEAYRKRDRKKLKEVAAKTPAVRKCIAEMASGFRRMWMSHNKPEGLETIQARFGMLDARYRELELRLKEYLDGKIETIAELEYKCPPK